MRKFFSFLIISFTSFSVYAQERLARPDSVIADSAAAKFIVTEIVIIGNKTTRENIITRELTFHLGDTLAFVDFARKFRRSEQNIFNTALFNSVSIQYVFEKEKLILYIVVSERWYIFPVPIFEIAERNFNTWWRTKDYSRVVYGGILYWNNFRGRDEELAFTLRLGYTQRFSLYYNIPYINKSQKAGLRIGFAHSGNHQIPLRTLNDTLSFFTDPDVFSKKETGGYITYNYRPNLYTTYSLEAGYKRAQVLDTVVQLNSDYFLPGQNQLSYLQLRYFLKCDHRDIQYYPLHGYYYDMEISRISTAEMDMHIVSGSTHIRRYKQLGKKLYAAGELSAKHTFNGYVPYYLQRGLGYGRDYLRGYEYYVMDGKSFALLKSNLKFELLPKKQLNAKFIPLNKFSMIPYAFYINVYADAGYVANDQFSSTNKLINSWQYSCGSGIDFVTYYDMVFRFEYSINKFGEGGFFLHFTSPI